jgi:hypothetical protein
METGPAQLAEAWKVFFVTAAGASATLVGLVIVAISVNLHRILEQPQLPSHGGATVAALVLILVTNMAQLIPNRARHLQSKYLCSASWRGNFNYGPRANPCLPICNHDGYCMSQ